MKQITDNNAIYFLHIPRSSGVFVNDLVLSSPLKLKSIIAQRHKIDKNCFSDVDFISGHYALTPVPFAKETFTILRDPVERTFSYLKYVSQVNRHLSMEDVFKKYLNEELLRKGITNQHSKFLTGELDLENYNKNYKEHKVRAKGNWSLVNWSEDVEDVKQSVSKNKIDILFYDDPDLYNKILIKFSLPKINTKSIKENPVNQSPQASQGLYEKYYQEMLSVNKSDLEVYSYFKNLVSYPDTH